ncbi:MAG: hypothetical protein P1V35_05065 [Planctomycetota bacterium]|nr:hypothetical protein [Planctomycetota bacterium]
MSTPAIDGAVMAQPSKRSPVQSTPVTEIPDSNQEVPRKGLRTELGQSSITRVQHDTRGKTHWALGRSYKAQADASGFTYMPFLGSQAPKTYGVSMRLTSATLGGDPIHLEADAHVERQADRLVLDRGPIDVWYDLDLESVEQSFALEVSGIDAELVLTIDVQSELALTQRASGIAYLNDLGGVTYDHAVVFDGSGKRLELPIDAGPGGIRLTVPASFMAQSVAPVVVDPILSTFQVHGSFSFNLTDPDVAYDLTTDRFAFVHTSEWSATDHDVWIETRSPTGAFDTLATIDFTSQDVRDPMVANDNTSDQFLVTSRRRDSNSRWEIIGRTVNALDINQLSPVLLIGSTDTNWENGYHDLGGKSQGTPLFMSVWDRHFFSSTYVNSRRRTITPIVPFSTTTPPLLSLVEATSISSAHNDTQVRISESSGTALVAEWRIIYARQEIATGIESMETVRFADDGTMVAPTIGFDLYSNYSLEDLDVTTGLDNVIGPDGGTTYGIAGMYVESGVEWAIWMFGMDGDTLFGGVRIKRSEHTSTTNQPMLPAVTVSATRFHVTYLENLPTPPHGVTCYTTALDLTGQHDFGVIDRRVVARSLDGSDFKRPATASRYDGGNYGSRYTATAVTDTGGALATQWATTQSQNLSSCPVKQMCFGYPNSTGDYGFITMTGSADTTGSKTLRASAMPLNQFGYFLAGRGQSSFIPPGSSGVFCIGGAAFGRYNQPTEIFYTGSTGEGTLTMDPAQLPAPGGPVPAVAGQYWYFQAWHRESSGDSNFTNSIRIRFE